MNRYVTIKKKVEAVQFTEATALDILILLRHVVLDPRTSQDYTKGLSLLDKTKKDRYIRFKGAKGYLEHLRLNDYLVSSEEGFSSMTIPEFKNTYEPAVNANET